MITINKLFNTDINIQGVNFRIQKIVIPEIQRDYVQGLEEYTNQLNNFLDVLFKALSSEDKCSLDFIYGNIENGVFEPIDGQQRITTLALLYYYIENICNENINNNIFNKIVYKTKNTATDFCRLLSKEYFIKSISISLVARRISLDILCITTPPFTVIFLLYLLLLRFLLRFFFRH